MLQRMLRSLFVSVMLLAPLASCTVAPPSPTPIPAPISTHTPAPLPTATLSVEGRAVNIPTEDSSRQLKGTLYGKSDVAVIFSNMGAQQQETWGPVPKAIAARGYMVLTYDMRYWVSDTKIDGNLRNKAADDLRAATAFARKEGAASLVLVGASLGGMATAKVAASEKPAAAVIMAAPMSANGLNLKVEDTEVQQITSPKLFIYSQSETLEIREGAQRMYDLAPQPKQIYVYPGAAHGTELLQGEQRDDLIKRLADFIESQAPAAHGSGSTVGQIVQTGKGSYTDLSPAELKKMLDNKDFLLADVHTPPEGRLPLTDVRVPFDQVEAQISKFPQDRGAKIVLTCRSGRMSSEASATLVKLGYTNVYNLSGGMNSWKAAGYEIIPESK